MPAHAIDYSKSTRSVCKGPAPCTGAPIPVGSLRYGQLTQSEFGETVSWRHWGCVTPEILRDLAVTDLDTVTGFNTIRREDQQKVRRAIAIQRVDPADIPASAKVAPPPPVPPVMEPSSSQSSNGPVGQKKRKLAFEHSGSFGSLSQSTSLTASALPASARRLVGDEDDEVALVEPEAVDEFYCEVRTSVVGVQYYKGLVGAGEQVRLVREPNNPYDRNAIQVKNISGIQVGHIPRNVASNLAPLLDRQLVTVEGVMQDGNLNNFNYSLSMILNIYGPSDKRGILEPMLVWATGPAGFPRRVGGRVPGAPYAGAMSAMGAMGSYGAGGAGLPGSYAAALAASMGMPMPGPSQSAARTPAQEENARKQYEALAKAAELRQMLSGLEKVDDEDRRASLLDKLCSTEDILSLPVHSNPPGVASGELVVDLLKHQSQALQWCIEHEYPKLPTQESDKPVQFWQYCKAGKKAYYFNLATKTPQDISTPPELGRGALVADSMGLGKTLTMISLVLATKKDVPKQHCNTTLIVAPLSVISNWEKQIEEHCVRGSLSACVYYGSTRNMTPGQMMKHDVVITTYQTVTGEADASTATKYGSDDEDSTGPARKKKKKGKGLFDVKWKRVILDEGHNIRNPRTKMAKAVCMLNAERRWVLSGTPIINSPSDLGSILTFLQICRPLDNEDFFKRLVLRPLKDGDPTGAELLRALMSHICIRRTKEMQDKDGKPLVPLPPVDVTLVTVTLSDEARTLYDTAESLSKQRVQNIINEVGGMNPVVTTNVLSMLTRLRQIALHPGLVPPDYLDQLRLNVGATTAHGSAISITPELKTKLQAHLSQAIEDNEECPICFNVVTDPRITSCSHVFCLACISEVIARDPKCPMDRRPLSMSHLVEPPPPTDLTQAPVKLDEDIDLGELRTGSSAKINQLIHLLKLIPSDSKSLVFSQFTSFLDKIGEALEEHGIPYVRFDGQLSARRRQEVLERFSIPLDPDAAAPDFEETPLPPTRQRRTRAQSTPVEDDDNDVVDGTDSDFVAENESDDEDFEEDISTRVKKTKGKGKAKAKAKGKGKARATPTPKQTFDGSAFYGVVPKVMLISLKAGALGLNLTVANNVFLMDPWWQEGIESQAIDRCNRIGQKKPVHVYQMIAENTVESKVIDIQEKKKLLIQHAFSGIKRTETQREKREARLQDLIQLFGIRNRRGAQE